MQQQTGPTTQPTGPTTQRPTTARPTGITILAILAAIAGVLGLFGSLLFIGIGGAFAGTTGLGGLVVVVGLLLLVLSVLYLVFAWGAWTLKPWAWTLGVGLSAASIVLTVLQLITGMSEPVGAIISIAISAVIIYYLFQANVKAAFGRA
jgi:hypothetical protein